MVHKQPHLNDRQRTPLLAVTELHQTAFLLPLEEVISQVIVYDTGIALSKFQTTFVHVSLDFIELFGKQRQSPVHLLQSAFRLLEELTGILKRGTFRTGIKYPCIYQHRQNAVQVILEQLVLLGYLLADIVQPQFIVYLLQEQVTAVVAALLPLLYVRFRVIFHDDILVLFFFNGCHFGNSGASPFNRIFAAQLFAEFLDGSELLNDFGGASSFICAVSLDGIQVCEASALFN